MDRDRAKRRAARRRKRKWRKFKARLRQRTGALVAILLALAVGAFSVFVVWRPANDAPADRPSPVARTAAPSTSADPVLTLDLPTQGSALFIGDSWTAGVAARKTTDGYAYVAARALGLRPQVFGFGSVGYVEQGAERAGGFQRRFELYGPPGATDLVILQGSQNDLGQPDQQVRRAVRALIRDVRDRYPGVPIAMMGPAPATAGLDYNLRPLDDLLAEVADEASVPYISPLDEDWFGSADWSGPRFTRVSPHPTTVGHAYVAQRLVEDLRALAAG